MKVECIVMFGVIWCQFCMCFRVFFIVLGCFIRCRMCGLVCWNGMFRYGRMWFLVISGIILFMCGYGQMQCMCIYVFSFDRFLYSVFKWVWQVLLCYIFLVYFMFMLQVEVFCDIISSLCMLLCIRCLVLCSILLIGCEISLLCIDGMMQKLYLWLQFLEIFRYVQCRGVSLILQLGIRFMNGLCLGGSVLCIVFIMFW